MKGVLVEKAGGEYTFADTVEKPKPGKGQILVSVPFSTNFTYT
jgi:hypothetical protein